MYAGSGLLSFAVRRAFLSNNVVKNVRKVKAPKNPPRYLSLKVGQHHPAAGLLNQTLRAGSNLARLYAALPQELNVPLRQEPFPSSASST